MPLSWMATVFAVAALSLALASTWLALRRTQRLREALQREQAAQAELQRSTSALRESEALYRSMVSVLDEGIVVFDAQGRVQACNARAQGFFGTDLQQMQEQGVLAQWQPVHADGSAMPYGELPLRRTLASGQPCRNVLVGVNTPQGEQRWLVVNAEPVRDAGSGQLSAVVTSFSDVTERHQREELLRRLSLAVEQSPVSILVSDTHGRIEYVNAAWSLLSGHLREEALGHARTTLQADPPAAPGREGMKEALARGEAWTGEVNRRRKDGRRYDERLRATPIRQPDGRITHHLLVGEDVTLALRTAQELDAHRHHLQELVTARTRELQAANAELLHSRDRAEAANRAKSAFLANTSHEIRTPMNAIIGLTHLMQRDVTDPQMQERLARVGEAARRLMRVLDDILDLSRIESGRLALAETDFALSGLLQRCIDQVSADATARGIHLQVQAQGLPELLRGDATRLAQVLGKLLDNALKFTERGQVLLQVAREPALEPALHAPGAPGAPGAAAVIGLRFTVQDSGIGIPAEQLSRLFAAFEQGDGSTTRRHGGTGLGLSIAQRLARLMGGDVGASSQPGVGSSFWFTALFRAASAPAVSSSQQAETRLRQRCAGARVLLAEDNLINQEVARALLEAAGLMVQAVPDGEQALDHVQQQPYDLVLMDMQMPRMDGLEATRRIRAELQGRPLPILAMTANAFSEDRDACLAAGMDGHVAKPVNPVQLYEELLKWLPATAAAPNASALPASGVAGGAAASGAVPGAGSPSVAPPPEASQLQALQDLLQAADFHAQACYREVAPAMRAHWGEAAVQALETALRGFDFEHALAALQALRESLPANPD